MKAIQYTFSVPRYIAGRTLGRLFPQVLWNGMACMNYVDVPVPRLPADDWVLVQTRLGGICGSDLATMHLEGSPYFMPLQSSPHTFGHENAGVIDAVGPQVHDFSVGERVVAEPLLWCRPRGFADLCGPCAEGRVNLCTRRTEGSVSPGYLGLCRDTGGSWSASYAAHVSQLYRVPDGVDDANALMVEPAAVGLHAVLQALPRDQDTVLILGAGTVGLCTLATLRALGCAAAVYVVARYPHQADAARRLGATGVLRGLSEAGLYREVANLTGATNVPPGPTGRPALLGGAGVTFDCIGSPRSIDDALRLTRGGGRVVVLGLPGLPRGVDWDVLVDQELHVMGSMAYHHAEEWNGRRWSTFELAIHLMATGKLDLAWLVTHRFRLDEYARAFDVNLHRGRERAIKTAFAFEDVGP